MEQRHRHREIADSLFHTVNEIKELHNGYTFLLPAISGNLIQAAEFISLERLCCPFFNFNLELKSDSQTLWLHITGDEGIKPFILAELGGHLRQQLLQSLQLHRTR